MKIDLHCHTSLSDGSLGVNELIALAKLRGIDVIAITDHDTLEGSIRAQECGAAQGVRVVPGVEISCLDRRRGRKAHILCYAPKRPERLEKMLCGIRESRRDAMLCSIQKVCRLYAVSPEMILARAQDSTGIYKQHVMQALIDAGYTDQMFGETFQKLFRPKDGLAYTRIDYPDVLEALDIVHAAGGTAVLAHPSEYDSMDLLQELCEKGLLQGAEASHPRNLPEDVKTIRELCARYGMAVTGGTDFHGRYTKVCNPPGTYLTDEAEFDKLKKMWAEPATERKDSYGNSL